MHNQNHKADGRSIKSIMLKLVLEHFLSPLTCLRPMETELGFKNAQLTLKHFLSPLTYFRPVETEMGFKNLQLELKHFLSQLTYIV